MAHLFFNNEENIHGTIYRITENNNDFNIIKNNLTNLDQIKIIEISSEILENIKLDLIWPLKFNGNNIDYDNIKIGFPDKNSLEFYLNWRIKMFSNKENRINNVDYTKFENYANQLRSIDINSITYPFNSTIPQYFKNIQLPYFNHLQYY